MISKGYVISRKLFLGNFSFLWTGQTRRTLSRKAGKKDNCRVINRVYLVGLFIKLSGEHSKLFEYILRE